MAMDRLWAPWRMEFIRNGSADEGCFLCRAGEGPASQDNLVVRRADTCFCLLNRYPYNNGHLLIAPYRHVARLDDLTVAERNEVMALTVEAKKVLDRAVTPHGYNVGANLGQVAGAGLESHFHMHIVPRWSGDVNFVTTIGSLKVIPQALEEIWSLLTEEWKRADA